MSRNPIRMLDGVAYELSDEETAQLTELEQIAVVQSVQLILSDLRMQRNTLLMESDWTQHNDSPLSEEMKQLWREYRQSLRDYMNTVTDPFNPPAWPNKP